MATNIPAKKKVIAQPVKKTAQKKNVPVKAGSREWFWLAGILLLTFIAFFPAISNSFTDWDDPTYLTDNPLIRNLNAANIRRIFTEIYFGNYQPLHILSYAIEYQLYKLNPAGYHTTSILMHLTATALVFWFIFSLTENSTVAIIAALLFGIHPMHVESVAWAAERKDMLYANFYLVSLIFYIKYIRHNLKMKYLFYTFLFFTLSVLSKAMACSLPPVLILLDIYFGRKLNAKLVMEKIPFFLLAIGLGIMSIYAASTTNTVAIDAYTFPQRILFASFNLLDYVGKLFVPVSLSAFYPYPMKVGGTMPVYYYVAPLVVIAVMVMVIRSMRKNKTLVFGLGFFAITVFLVLQLLPVGAAIRADRYSYLPSIGIFYLVGSGLYWLWNKKELARNFKWPSVIALGIIVIFFSAATYARCGSWKNGMTMWNDVISKYPNVHLAYINRGILLSNDKRYDEAMRDYNKAIELEPGFPKAYNNRGGLLRTQRKYDESIRDFTKAIELQPNYPIAYNNRGLVLKVLKKYEEARKDFTKAIELQPNYPEAYVNRGAAYRSEKKYDEALKDYNRSLEIQPNYSKAYHEIGILYASQGNYDEALRNYDKAIELQPDFANAYTDRGSLFKTQLKFQQAIRDYDRAIELQPNSPEAYYNRGITEYDSGNKTAGCEDLKRSAGLGFQLAANEYNSLCH